MPRSPLHAGPASRCRPACLVGSLAAVALLSACASGPQISAQQESNRYLSQARRSYTPPGPAGDPWGPYIHEAAAKYDVPHTWIREVMRQESGGNLYGRGGELITSGAGAMGLMQVMPGTYDELRTRYPELGSDPFDPHNNILAGTAYLREMYDIYGSPGFLAAYNAGPGRLDDYLTRSRRLPEETRRYVASIGPRIAGAFPTTRSPGEQYARTATPLQLPDGSRFASSQAGASLASAYSPAVARALNPAPFTPAPAVAEAAPPRAEPSGPFIKLSPPQPVQVAQLPEPSRAEPAGPFIKLSPQPERLASLPEPAAPEPRGPFIALSPQPSGDLPEPPRVEPPFTAPRLAQLPEPPRPPVQPQYARTAEPARQFAALTPAAPSRSARWSLIPSANAAPVRPRYAGPTSGAWAVQVGAFGTANLASAATAAARNTARDVLGGARPAVSTVRQSRGTLYRARLTGLSHDAAAHACERLVRVRTNCMIVSPDAQS